jgi:hypothetical protein
LLEREGTAHIGVENEEAVRSSLEDSIAEMVETTGGAQRLVFAKVFDADVWVGARAVFDEVPEDGLVVVAHDEDLADLGHAGDGGEAVLDDGVTGDFEKRLPQ